MLEIQNAADNIVEVSLRGSVRSTDFQAVGGYVDGLVARFGSLRLLLDVSEFQGWHDLRAANAHFALVRDHHHRVERIAVLASTHWQQWLVSALGAFVQPEIRIFAPDDRQSAQAWLAEIE